MNTLPRANKDFGQHFLIDRSIISAITNHFPDHKGPIIEVGPGPGILSKELITRAQGIIHLIEKDQRFAELLYQIAGKDHVSITDALKMDINQLIDQKGWGNESILLVSNLPYNISVPLFIKFLKIPRITKLTLMFQKEVGEKIFPGKDEKNSSGSLQMLAHNYFDTQLVTKVRPGAFNPPPKVNSIVLSFQRKTHPKVNLDEFNRFENFLRILFQHKRKQLQKVLKTIIDPESLFKCLENLSIDPQIRAESLGAEQIYDLFEVIYLGYNKK